MVDGTLAARALVDSGRASHSDAATTDDLIQLSAEEQKGVGPRFGHTDLGSATDALQCCRERRPRAMISRE